MRTKNDQIVIAVITTSLVIVIPSVAQNFEIPWHTTDAGGQMLTSGGDFELSGTIGQPDAGVVMTGGTFELTGGFWPGATSGSGPAPGDFDGDGDVDAADFTVFAQCFGGSANPPAPACPPGVDADFDDDGDVDAADFVLFGQLFTGSL